MESSMATQNQNLAASTREPSNPAASKGESNMPANPAASKGESNMPTNPAASKAESNMPTNPAASKGESNMGTQPQNLHYQHSQNPQQSPRPLNRRRKQKPDNRKALEVHIISAQKLPKVAFLQRTRPYAVAWVDSQPQESKRTTPIDPKGGRNPTWNSLLTFTIDTEHLELQHGISAGMTIEIFTKAWPRDRLIGTVRVLIADLEKSKGKCLTYMIIRPDGRRQGLLNLGMRPDRYYEDEIVLYQPPAQVDDARGLDR